MLYYNQPFEHKSTRNFLVLKTTTFQGCYLSHKPSYAYSDIELIQGACSLSVTIGNSRIITIAGHFECINSDTHNTF